MKSPIEILDEMIRHEEQREDRYLKQIQARTDERLAKEGPFFGAIGTGLTWNEEARKHTLYQSCIARIGALIDAKRRLSEPTV